MDIRFWWRAGVANKRVIGGSVRFRAFWGLPNRTKFYQFLPKACSEGVRTGSKRQLTRAFSRPVLLKRVKSGGSCQPVIGVHFLQNSCGLRAKDPPTQRHRATEKNDRRWETKGTFMSSSFFLCVAVPLRLILDGNLLIRRRLFAKLISRRSHCKLILKDLLSRPPANVTPLYLFLSDGRDGQRAIY